MSEKEEELTFLPEKEELTFLLSILQVSEPADLRGNEEFVVRNLLDVKKKEELLVLINPLQKMGIALGDKSLIKISALIKDLYKEECLKKPFDGPLIRITHPLANSVKHSFYSSGPKLYLITTDKEATLDDTNYTQTYDPEVRLLKSGYLDWRIKLLDQEKNEFKELYTSTQLRNPVLDEDLDRYDPTTFAIMSTHEGEHTFLGVSGIISAFPPGGGEQSKILPSSIHWIPRFTFTDVIIARVTHKGKFLAIVSRGDTLMFGKIAFVSNDEDVFYTIFYPSLLRVIKAVEIPQSYRKLVPEGIYLDGGFEVFFGIFVVVIVWKTLGPGLGVFNEKDIHYGTDPGLVEDTSWLDLSGEDELNRITKISNDHFNIGVRTFKINEKGKISELTKKPMKEILSRPIDSNVVYFDEAFYYFRRLRLHVFGKSMIEESILFPTQSRLDPTGENHLFIHNEDLYWIHLNRRRTGFMRKLCFPLIGVKSLPPTLSKKIFPRKRQMSEPVEF